MPDRESLKVSLRALVVAACVVGTFGLALAKLPAPPPMDEKAKATAEEKKAKDAAQAAADAKLVTQAQDRVATRYIAEQKAKGVVVTPTPIAPPAPPGAAPPVAGASPPAAAAAPASAAPASTAPAAAPAKP